MIGQTNLHILKNRRQRLLRGAMTDAERSLWRFLRGRQMAGYKFRRQHPFGDFILDFVCLEKSPSPPNLPLKERDNYKICHRFSGSCPETDLWIRISFQGEGTAVCIGQVFKEPLLH